MNDTLIQSFLSVAEEGSFCKAAEKIYISQPNLSRNIARLEKELDTQLFDRSGKHIALTEAGRIYEKAFQKMKQCFAEASVCKSASAGRGICSGRGHRIAEKTVDLHAGTVFEGIECGDAAGDKSRFSGNEGIRGSRRVCR